MGKENNIYGSFFVVAASIMMGVDGGLLVGIYSDNFKFSDIKFIVFISHFIMLVVMSIFFSNRYKLLKSFSYQDFIYFSLIALLGGVIGTFSIIKALQLTNFSKISIVILLQKLQPIFAISLSIIILKESPKIYFYLIAFVAILSSYFMIFGLNLPSVLNEKSLLSALYSILAAFCYGSSLVFGKKVLIKYDFISGTFFRFLFTTIIIAIIILFSGDFIYNIKYFIEVKYLLYFAFVYSLWGGAEVFIYYLGLKNTPAFITSICELAYPLTAVVIDIYLGNNIFNSYIQIIAAGLLILSILVLNIFKNKFIN